MELYSYESKTVEERRYWQEWLQTSSEDALFYTVLKHLD